jgi:Chaperone of endosialidase
MKKTPFSNRLTILFILLFSMMIKTGLAQTCTTVRSLTVNTGYNPLTNQAIATGVADPNWIITGLSGPMQAVPNVRAIGTAAVAVGPHPAWVNTNATSGYISCFTASSFTTPASATAPNPPYTMTVTRSFRTCQQDTYTFNLNVADDNFITSLSVDGGVNRLAQGNVNNFTVFAALNFSILLNPGVHTIDITLQNSCEGIAIPQNFYGVNLFGTITGTTNSLVSPASAANCTCFVPPTCSDTCYWKVTGNNIINGNNILGTLTNHDIRIFSGNIQRGVINSNGFFGWQTPNPSTLFHIDCANPPAQVPSNLRFENLPTGIGTTLVVDANGYVLRGRKVLELPPLVNNCGDLNFVTKTGNPGFLECSQIYDDGSFVGIATTTPFLVNGTMSTLNVNGLTVSNSFYALSDQKYKQDIATIKDASSIINKLRGVTYTWNRKAYPDKKLEDGLQAGFIAQEVNKVYPLAVASDGNNGYLVNYNSFIPLLVQGQQELNKKIDELTQKNQDLQDEITRLYQLLNTAAGNDRTKGKITGSGLENKLFQNKPNPFGSTTAIDYFIATPKALAFIIIYDLTGKELLRFKIANSGNGSIQLTASQLSNGIYLYSLVIDGKEIETRKMTLSRN